MLTIQHTEVSYDKVDVPVCICLQVDQCDEQTVHITILIQYICSHALCCVTVVSRITHTHVSNTFNTYDN